MTTNNYNMLGAMQEDHSERINLPLTPSMYAAVKLRAVEEQMSAVGFIRKCIEGGLREGSKLIALEDRISAIEAAIGAQREGQTEWPKAPVC